MSEQEVKKVNDLPERKAVNMLDIQIPEFTDVKELLTIRQGKRTAYLENVASNLVIDIPSRSAKGGPFNRVTRVEYHSIDDTDWHNMQMEKAKQMDMARSLQLDVDDYKKNGIKLPPNWTTLSQNYFEYQDKVNDLFCQMFLGKKRSELGLCDQQLLQDVIDAYELKHRLGLVNLERASRNSGNISSIT